MNTLARLLLSVSSLLATAAMAQTFPGFEVERGSSFAEVVSDDKLYFRTATGVLAVKYTKDDCTAQVFDPATMKQTAKEKLIGLPKGRVIEEIYQMGDRLIMFYSVTKAPSGPTELFARELSTTTGAFVGEARSVLTVDAAVRTDTRLYTWGVEVTDQFSMALAANGERIRISWEPLVPSTNKREPYGIGPTEYAILAKDLSVEWRGKPTLPPNEHGARIRSATVDGKGDLWAVAVVFDVAYEDKYWKLPRPGHLELLVLDAATSSWSSKPLDVGNMTIHGLEFFEGTGGTMLCAGYYSDRPDATGATGLLSFSVERSGKMGHMVRSALPAEIITPAPTKQSKRAEKKGLEVGIANLELVEVLPMSDGGYISIGEQRHRTTAETGAVSSIISHFDDVLMTRTSADGTVVWARRIAKDQASFRTRGIGAGGAFYEGTDRIWMFYFDHLDNMERPDEKPAAYVDERAGRLTAQSVDLRTGQATRFDLFQSPDFGGKKLYKFGVHRFLQLKPDEFLLETHIGEDRDMLVKISAR